MDVRLILTAILTTVSGCPTSWCCPSDNEPFRLDEPVTAADLDAMVGGRNIRKTWDDLDCKTVCWELYKKRRGWIAEVDSCEMTWPEENLDGSGKPGHVNCEGHGYERFCEGRRPLGHVEHGDADCHDPLGRTLAAMAYLEAASIFAFEQLAAQLRGWDAPVELIARCRAAADDERGHARALTYLAESRGAVVPIAAHVETAPGLLDVAVHNAVEGCVHETFAALLAAVRARLATSTMLRRVFANIAVDEAGHGQLAWDIHAWLQTRLDANEQATVAAAQSLALTRLPERARQLASLPAELGPLASSDAEALARALVERLAA